MAKTDPRICANCKLWNPIDVQYDHPEDECGTCRGKNGGVVYGDEEACEDFKPTKSSRTKNKYR